MHSSLRKKMMEVECVSSGSASQAHSKFKGNNKQCTAMAYVASIISTIKKRSVFSKNDIDLILNEGDALYIKLEPNLPNNIISRFLSSEDLPSKFNIKQYSVDIHDMKDYLTCLAGGYYPNSISEINEKILELVDILKKAVYNSEHNDINDSALFIGNGYTVSLWRHNNEYFYFNSHSVDQYNKTAQNGVARLFKCNNIEALANLLLSYNMSTNGSGLYALYRVRVLNVYPELINTVIENTNAKTKITTTIHSTVTGSDDDIVDSRITEFVGICSPKQTCDNSVTMDDKTISLVDCNTQTQTVVSNCIDNIDILDDTTISLVDSEVRSDDCQFIDNGNKKDDITNSWADNETRFNGSQCSDLSPTILTDYIHKSETVDSVIINKKRKNCKPVQTRINECSTIKRTKNGINTVLYNLNEISTSPTNGYMSNCIPVQNLIETTNSINCSTTPSNISDYSDRSPPVLFEGITAPLLQQNITNNTIKNTTTQWLDDECSSDISPSILVGNISSNSRPVEKTYKVKDKTIQSIVSECGETSPSILIDLNATSDPVQAIANSTSSIMDTTNVSQMKTKRTTSKPVLVERNMNDDKLSVLEPIVVIEPLNLKPSMSSNKRGRPKKIKRGRPKTTQNSHLTAVQKYNEKNPDVNRAAVQKYNEKKPDVHRAAVQKYNEKKPDVHRAAVQKYNEKKPDVHRAAVQKYNEKKPDMHRAAVQKYNEKKPDVHRAAVQKYNENKPDVHRAAVKKYIEKNPDVNRAAVHKYNEKNPDVNRQSVTRYNETSRNIDVPLRRSRNLIGEKRGEELNTVKLFSLKKPCLNSSDVYVCPQCGTRLFDEEKSRIQWCCGSGSYNIQTFAPLNEDFYTNPSFVKRPRAYNNMFAFSALGITHGQHQPDGIAFLKIQGRIYHRVFDLAYNKTTNNTAMHINDNSERESIAAGENLDMNVIRSITNYLHNVNPYIECFKRLSLEASSEAFIQFERTSRATHGNILGDQPVGREVSAIISTDREEYVPRSIAVWKIGDSKPHTVDIMHILYECFQYPLLYTHGETGWFPGRLDRKGVKLTQVKYVRCLLLSIKRFSEIGRLSEEWIVDMFCRVIEERLRYLLHMQKQNRSNELRTAPLQELLNDETIIAEGIIPGRIYLPSSFTGGPRYMKEKYLDAMATVNNKGPPTYFVTLTCNPNWTEIRLSTPPGQRPNPLICARAFNLRLAALIRDIRSGLWFGEIEYLMYVIEFQKRGLPHAHICFRIKGGGPVDNLDIDKVCRADIPPESEAGGRLRKAVLDHMIHGPCGGDRSNLPCYDKEKKKCSKRFPKRESDVTFCDEKGFINLRRDSKNEGVIKFRGREIKINDLWVVPYNAALLLKYDAHINVEVSSQRSVVKYLFKYMTKGPDEARVAIVGDGNNEIEEYETKRYVGSCEAIWRILEFDVTAREPNVKQLSVHLENQQAVYFRPGDINEAVRRGGSDLITYFNRPQGEIFDDIKYIDFYEKYIIHTKRPTTKTAQIFETQNGKFITPRQRGEIVARMFWVAPNRGEQFYLRILLNSFPCRSYGDLLKLGGPECKTFQDAAKAVGLADDQQEYEMAIREATTFFTGHRLRKFFVLLAVSGVPVASLWDTFKNQLSEDILHRMPNEEEKAYNLCLTQINRLLRKHGFTLAQHGLPEVHDDTTELGRERVEYNINTQISIVNEWMSKLSSEQREVFDYIDRLCVDEQYRETNSCAIFVDGPAGTGKTLLLNVITAHVRGNLKGIVLCTASSAIAAQNHEGGITAHSMFKYPLDIEDDYGYWNITNGTQRADLIYHSDVIIYDEAPMAHKFLIHLLDRSLRDLMNSDKIFGGKIIIFAGDFRQIPPVVTNAKSNSDILNCSVKTSSLWQKLKTFSLLTSQRCRDDPEYADFLLRLGSNELPSVQFPVGGRVESVVSLESIELVSNLDELIDFVFGLVIDEPDVCAHRAILCTRNNAVREINSTILERVPGEMLHFYSNDKVEQENTDQLFLGPDFLNKIQPQGVPEFDLKLKEGCVCMIIRNLSFADGLINGTKVIVVSTSPRLITVRKPGGHDNYLIPRILFKAPVERKSPFEMCRRQFPLQVCYAMTIHKSQGQTIGRVGVDLRSDVFSHGQLYVALGRVQEKRNIKILMHEDRVINGNPFATNKVISELL